MDIAVREAIPTDAEAIAEISTHALGYACDASLTQRRLNELDPAREKVFVAVANCQVVGFIHAERYQLLYQETAVNILGLAVDVSFQGMGIGRALLEAAEAWAREIGCARVRLNSGSTRLEAHGFYEHLGYRNTKFQKRYVKSL